MPERTAGQRAYETYAALLQAQWPMAVWSGLSALERYAWEAAAQAVRAAPLFRFALGDAVQVRGDAARYTIHSRGAESTARGRDLVWYRLARDGAVLETVGDDVLMPAGPPGQEEPHG